MLCVFATILSGISNDLYSFCWFCFLVIFLKIVGLVSQRKDEMSFVGDSGLQNSVISGGPNR